VRVLGVKSISPATLQSPRQGSRADALTSLLVGRWTDRWDNWAAPGGCKMTVQHLVEVVIIVIVIYVAVRLYRKRG